MKAYLIFAAMCCAAMCGCGGAGGAGVACAGDTVTSRAALLTVVERPGWVEVAVADPWHEGHLLGHYALVPDSAGAAVPKGLERVSVPLRRSIVYSGIHTAAIEEIGAAGAVAAVADAGWLADTDPFKVRVAAGTVADIGSSMSPSVEAAIAVEPDAVLLSPYENGSSGGIERCGAAIINMADYMEQSPRGRAEWLVLLGYLYGAPARARHISDSIIARYDSIAARVAASQRHRPRVFTERPQSGIWYVPAGGSYMARMITDAGGEYVWADTPGGGSVPLDEASVLDRASDAPLWLLKEYGGITARALEASVPRARVLKAFPGGVWVCDTRAIDLYRDLAFWPDRVLSDMAAVFAGADSTRYFNPLPR